MAISKMSRNSVETTPQDSGDNEDFLYDFGESEIVPVEISPGKFFMMKEPTVADLIEIGKLGNNKALNDVEITARVLCILHTPEPGKRKITYKEAQRIPSSKLRKIGEAVNILLNGPQEEKSEEEQNSGDEETD